MSDLGATCDAHVQAELSGLPVVGPEQAEALLDQRRPKNELIGSGMVAFWSDRLRSLPLLAPSEDRSGMSSSVSSRTRM